MVATAAARQFWQGRPAKPLGRDGGAWSETVVTPEPVQMLVRPGAAGEPAIAAAGISAWIIRAKTAIRAASALPSSLFFPTVPMGRAVYADPPISQAWRIGHSRVPRTEEPRGGKEWV